MRILQFQNRRFSGAVRVQRWSSLLCGLMLVGAFGTANAAERVSIYATERIIAQSASESRQVEVLADALNEVLIRASGVAELPEHRALTEARRSPQNLLNRFSLGDSEETLPDAIGNPQPTYNLDLRFEESMIHDLLADAGLPVWSAVRPEVLFLVAGPDGQRIDLLRDDPAIDVVNEARRQAQRQGISVLWPLLDLEDSLTVGAEDIWGGFSEPMLSMAERYSADAVLGGYIGLEPDTGRWIGRWHLVIGHERISETHFAEEQGEVVQAGVKMAAQAFSERYGLDLSGNDTETLEFSVLNLTNLNTHGAVRRYLNSMLGVDNVQLLSLDGDTAQYQLDFAADQQKWLDILALERRLQTSSSIRAFGDTQGLELIWRD